MTYSSRLLRDGVKNGLTIFDQCSNRPDDGTGKSFCDFVRVKDSVIAEVNQGSPPPIDNDEEIIDASGCVLMPGLVNAHTHLCCMGGSPALAVAKADLWSGTSSSPGALLRRDTAGLR